jgi:hypothetical protein
MFYKPIDIEIVMKKLLSPNRWKTLNCFNGLNTFAHIKPEHIGVLFQKAVQR